MIDLRHRRITGVNMGETRTVRLADGSPGIEGTLTLRLSDEEGGEEGPLVTIALSTPVGHDDPEQSLVEGARAVLERLARESEEELSVLLKMFRKTGP